LSATVLIGKGKSEKKLALTRTALKLVQDLREMEEKAMGAEKVNCSGTSVTYSFGVYFNSSFYPFSYFLFADCDNNQRKSGSDVLLKEVFLEKGVKICKLLKPGTHSQIDETNIVFSPPDPMVFISYPQGAIWQKFDWGKEQKIILCLEDDPAVQKIVKVNNAGKIEIE